MSWTYSADPSASSVDAVRFLTGQTSSADAVLLSNEEIAWLVTQQPNVYYAAAQGCNGLASRYSGMVKSKTVGDLTLVFGERAKEFTAREATLRMQGAMRGTELYAGGVEASDFTTRQTDSTTLAPQFAIGMDDRTDTGAGALANESS